jgi:uncharacterized protein YecE (DUF72 family)
MIKNARTRQLPGISPSLAKSERLGTRVRIGTASWTDPGFVADWYPSKLPPSARLRWYSQHFNYVEVNSTFYAIPTIRTVERWASETPDDFLFDAKLPKVLSRHRMHAKFLPPDIRSKVLNERGYVVLNAESERLILSRFLEEMKPLRESKKLAACLLQLSPSFRPKNHRLTELDSIRDLVAPHELAVELRNRDWVTGEQLSETLEYFNTTKTTLVSVDAPKTEHFTVMPDVDEITNPKLGYFRFHGRNAHGYVSGRTVADRFDYDYPESEVIELADRINKVASRVEQLHIVANNNRSNYAPKLAGALLQKLGARLE